jgi:DNA-binding MarR family transcriptional regulator
LEEFSKEPKTTKQVATVLGEKPTKLYHHVDFLEKNGLLRLVKKQQNRGTTEKYFQAVASKFIVCKELVKISSDEEGKSGNIENLLLNALEDSLKNLRESIEKKLSSQDQDQTPIILINSKIRLSKEQIPEFSELIQNWLDKNTNSNSQSKSLHQLTMVVFPVSNK